MSKENLTKSIDTMIDEIFAKSDDLDVASLASTKADEVVNKAPKAEKDSARGAGRPEQISAVPEVDQDGKRSGKYDADIAKKQAEEDQKEADQVKMAGQDKGEQKADKPEAGMPMAKSISQQEWEEYQAFKKAQSQKSQEEVLKKAREENRDLIKSAIKEATAHLAKENETLRKSVQETTELVKAMAERPQRRKSVDGIQALEKSQSEEKGPQTFSKSEMLDVAEELCLKKGMEFRDEHLIELENTGFIFDKRAREALEVALKNKK